MEIIGYFASLLIGVSLGLIGGGGSILTVPVLVYLFGYRYINQVLNGLVDNSRELCEVYKPFFRSALDQFHLKDQS